MPDEVMVKLISTELKTLEKANLSWLLDGFPRTRAQVNKQVTPILKGLKLTNNFLF